jgi:molybdopterin synthase catalytic subunit
VSSPSGEDWLALTRDRLPVEEALAWAVRPDCGAVIVFCGTVRDHAEGRTDVTGLEYEAYESQVRPRLQAIVDEVRSRWPETGRVALLHRIGALALTETSVVVVASAPHRAEAFDAARFAIDSLKATVPIWKRESWREGTDWGTGSQPVAEVGN